MNPEEAQAFGLIDEVFVKRPASEKVEMPR